MIMNARIALMSHLSDLEIESTMVLTKEEGNRQNRERMEHRVRFLKYLTQKLNGNFDQEVDIDEMYSNFKTEEGL